MHRPLNHKRDTLEGQHVLLDRAYIAVEEETFEHLYKLLDPPPEPTEGLRQLMRVKTPWAERNCP
jgi:uncharacterized protein (DUF1778 family)